jgi:glutamine synthetase
MSTMHEHQRDYVLRTVEERGIRLVRLWFTDVLGNLKSFAISPAEMENALNDGMSFDGSSIDGFSRVQESDVLAIPDANTFEVLPWADAKGAEARVFCDIAKLDGTPFDGDPRQVLRRNLSAARDKGYSFYIAPDIEYFYFAPPDGTNKPVLLDQGGFFDLTSTDIASSLRKETIRTLETMSIPVEYSFHEDAPSQHEIDLRHTDALTMADSVMTFRFVVKEIAALHDVHATFMPKPLETIQGSGMHLHLSLFEGENNAFHSADDPYNLSPTAKSFMAGLLHHAAEITAVTNQTINSYKRLVPGFEAPVHISWARNNRSGLIRVPIPKRGSDSATRIEYRSPDPACNPYLAFSVILAAGMRGIEQGYELPAEADANLFEMDDAALEKMGIQQLPQSLSEALRVMENSSLVADALGDHIFEWFLRNKRAEWRSNCRYDQRPSHSNACGVPIACPGRSCAHARFSWVSLESGCICR